MSKVTENISEIQESVTETVQKSSQASTLDTRTFSEIWKSLTRTEQENLKNALLVKGCTTTRQTINNWANDKKRPSLLPVKKAVAQVVSKVIGSRVSGETLFPAR